MYHQADPLNMLIKLLLTCTMNLTISNSMEVKIIYVIKIMTQIKVKSDQAMP